MTEEITIPKKEKPIKHGKRMIRVVPNPRSGDVVKVAGTKYIVTDTGWKRWSPSEDSSL